MGRVVLAVALAVALAAAVIACGDTTTDDATGAAPVASPAETASAGGADSGLGARVYAENCSGCHGADGSGAGQTIAGEDDTAGVVSVVEGGAEGMPGFSGSLSAAEIEAVSAYVAGGLR